jgi:hypothetical protein
VLLFGAADVARAIDAVRLAHDDGHRVGALLRSPLDAPVDVPVAMRAEPDGYARALNAGLHAREERRCDVILVERVPDGAAWAGVRDRIERAAR